MTDPLEQFAQLASRARQDAPPAVDVSARVLAGLRHRQPAETVDRTMLVCSSLALAASVLFAMWGLDVWSTLTDPLSGLMQATAVMQ